VPNLPTELIDKMCSITIIFLVFNYQRRIAFIERHGRRPMNLASYDRGLRRPISSFIGLFLYLSMLKSPSNHWDAICPENFKTVQINGGLTCRRMSAFIDGICRVEIAETCPKSLLDIHRDLCNAYSYIYGFPKTL
jgi:hypothetical protein